MIPHRMLSNEIPDSGLRDRVTACRKRLRERRMMLKALATTGVEELFPEPTASVSRLQYNREPGVRFATPAPVAQMSCSPFDGAERLEEQEAGIT
jgi:hypothetical protein